MEPLVAPVGVQAPNTPTTTTPALQETLSQFMSMYNTLQAALIPLAAATSQAGGGAQTPAGSLSAASGIPALPRPQKHYYTPPVSRVPPARGAISCQFSKPGLSQSQLPCHPRACSECGDTRHMVRDCPRHRRGAPPKTSHPQRAPPGPQAMITTPAATPPAQLARGLPRLEWRGTLDYTPFRVISFLKAQRMVENGCDAYLAYVRDDSIDTPIFDSVPIVRDFPDAFPVDLQGMPPDIDINFCLDLLTGTQPISIPPYRFQHLFKQKDLNLHQRRWLELLKDFDITILYHTRKANMVADALSHQAESLGSLSYLPAVERPMALDVRALSNQFVKYEHHRPSRLLQKLEIPQWKWKRITMDFVVGLPRTRQKFNAIWVIVDRLTKSAHFLPVVTTYSSEQLARVYIREIVRLHGVPISIISDRGTQFTLRFWRAVQYDLGTRVELSTSFHPQTDG
ncbi:uncharacterized protein [Nicotiana sylvestris]|uniref:uncharacterized protein n=1 Tax=Nicotiana sylvestris TaxID=4096 RepID=UPI00388CAB33